MAAEPGVNGRNRRPWALLGLLAVAVLVYARFGPGLGLVVGESGALPPIDLAGLDRKLQGISTVSPGLIALQRADSHPDRNLFQYGSPKPPPVDPAELERRRLAAQQALIQQEEEARRLRQQQEEQRRLAEAQAPPAPPPPQAPPSEAAAAQRPPQRPKPPDINLKLVGMMGSSRSKIGVFLNGESTVLAKKGEVLEGKFKVLDFGAEYVEMGYVDPAHKGQTTKIWIGS